VLRFRDANGPLVGLTLFPGGDGSSSGSSGGGACSHLLAASHYGDIRLWDPRMYAEPIVDLYAFFVNIYGKNKV
jgi:hypothetical protein